MTKDIKPTESKVFRAQPNDKPYNKKYEGNPDNFNDWIDLLLDDFEYPCEHPFKMVAQTHLGYICTKCNTKL